MEAAIRRMVQTVDGGKKTEAQAESQWSQWEIMKAADPKSVIWDMDGPEAAPLQFRVAMGKDVDFGSAYSHEKVLESSQKFKKDASPEETGEGHRVSARIRVGVNRLESVSEQGACVPRLMHRS